MRQLIRHILIVIILLAGTLCAYAQEYQTAVQGKNIYTLRLSQTVLTLDETLEVSFDELSHETHLYSFTVRHLNADWTPDQLETYEYIDGFSTSDVTTYEHSFNTQQLYTHYSLTFPNDDMAPKVSGNYVLLIYEDGRVEEPVATACFSIVEPKTRMSINIRSNTDIELSGRYQQLDIDLNTNGLRTISPDEFTLVVEQNGRRDNRAFAPRPTYVESSRLRWTNCKALIFEGGHEYQHFDVASVYFKGNNVDQIQFDHTYYHAFLFPSVLRATEPYISEPDADGAFVINAERTDYDDTEADYMFVHFFLPAAQPWFDGQLYLLGEAWHNRFTPANRLTYDNELQGYVGSCYLKQGGYEWLYAFVPKGNKKATLQRVEGSHWQTENTYRAYVYHRAPGARYDALIAVMEQQ